MLRHSQFCPNSFSCCFSECRGIGYSAIFFSISDVMAFCAQCCDIEATANLLNSANAMTSSPQCLGIQSIFLILYSFWVLSFFFRFQCSNYHLQNKITYKSIQNDNNPNKIPKYRGLKIHQFSLLSIPSHLDFASPRAN